MNNTCVHINQATVTTRARALRNRNAFCTVRGSSSHRAIYLIYFLHAFIVMYMQAKTILVFSIRLQLLDFVQTIAFCLMDGSEKL